MNLDTEWVAIDWLPGYAVNSGGEVNGPRGVRKLQIDMYGYLSISIRRKTYRVHHLVCSVFHGERPSPTHQVRHLNGIRTDARAENLAWGTPAENSQDRLAHGNNPQANKTHCLAGHQLIGDNLYLHPKRGGRDCKECRRRRNRIYMRTYVPKAKRLSA
jgi:hypothetical protein